jgi:ATP-binding cassette, subfamily B, bacterial
VLFAMSIEENIMYGSEGACMASVQRAARMANAHDFIMRIPDSYKAQAGARPRHHHPPARARHAPATRPPRA